MIEIAANIITIHPANKPSIPSIKLQKFIIPIPEITKNMKNNSVLIKENWLERNISLLNNKKTQVKNWDINLNDDDNPLLSSMNPTIVIGKIFKVLKFKDINSYIIARDENTNPPDLGLAI